MRDSSALDPLFQAAGDQYGIDPVLLKALSFQESGLNPNVRDSYQGAQGLMQILPSTARGLGITDPRDPAQAIPAAAKYLAEGYAKTGTAEGAVLHYHGGPDQRQWGPKTRAYAQSVANHYQTFTKAAPMASRQAPAAEIPSYVDDLVKIYGVAPAAPAAPAATGQPQAAPTQASAGAGLKSEPSVTTEIPGLPQSEIDSLVATYGAMPAATPATPAAPAAPAGSRTGAAVAGFTEGLPIVGPYVRAGVEKGAAALRSLVRDERYSDSLKAIQSDLATDIAAHPNYHLAGEVAGGVAGTVPMMAAAPAAFGVGTGNIMLRSAAGLASGASIGAADSAVRSGGDLEATARGAAWGGGLGFAGPGVGKALGYAGNKLMNAASGATPAARNTNTLFEAAGMSPTEVRSALHGLGPNAVLADVSPAVLADARALAARGGETTATMKNAMATRAAGADDRAAQLMERHLGPKPDLNASVAAIEDDAARRAGPLYNAGRAGPPMDVVPILQHIDGQMGNATGGVEKVLNTVRGFLMDKVASAANPTGLAVPKADPGAILQARQALDDFIGKLHLDTSAGKNAARVANDLRGRLDAVVKSNPHFAQGDQIFAQSMGVRDAMQQGLDTFKRNVRPEDLARRIQSMTPEELSAHQAGARVAIGDAMEQASRGELQGAQSMFARGSANRAKLDALFPNAREALDALHSQATMRNTERVILGGSHTAETNAAINRYSPGAAGNSLISDIVAAGQGAALGDPTGGLATAVARRGGSNLLDAARARMMDNMARGTARGMVAVGPEQAAFIAAVERANALQGPNRLMQTGADIGATLSLHGMRNRLTGR